MPSKPMLLAGLFFAAALTCFLTPIEAAPLARPIQDMSASDDYPGVFAQANTVNESLVAQAPQTPHSAMTKAAIAAFDEIPDFDVAISAAVAQVLSKAPRKHLADFAMKLRDIRYRRGGHEPATGFDCSGFVHYVYHQTFGLDLPFDAPGQFVGGEKVAREDMKTGDLVFFREGKRISHVGIYLGEDRFIHSPSPGKRVRVDRLDSTYWAKRFAGAKRPDVLS